MRETSRNHVAAIVDASLAAPFAAILDGITELVEQIADVSKAVAAVQPVTVELDQELADRIVEKMHGPLTIPQAFSDWIREQAIHADVMMIQPLGYGIPATMRYVLKSNGTMYLMFNDSYGTRLWEGTFVPPDFAKDH